MTCTGVGEALGAFVDREVDNAEEATIEAHVSACERCSAELESLHRLKHAVSQLEGRATPSEAVCARVEAHRFAPRRRVRWQRALGITGAAAAMFLGAIISVGDSSSALTEKLVADHLEYSQKTTAAEVASPDAAEVKRYFQGRVPFAPAVPVLPHSTLIGGRLCSIDGRAVELLFYEMNGDPEGRRLSLYVSNATDKPNGCDAFAGQRVCIRRGTELTFMLVGNAPAGELEQLLSDATL